MKITATATTPSVVFDEARKALVIEGESYPENSFEFYRPVLAWVEARVEEGPLEVRMAVKYMNTSSVKCVMDLFDRLEDAHGEGRPVSVVWQHGASDERSRELGEEFKEDLTLPFSIIAIE